MQKNDNERVFKATIQHLLPDGVLENELAIAFHPEDRSFTLVLATREKTATIKGFSAHSSIDIRKLKKEVKEHIPVGVTRRHAFDFIDRWTHF